jgi:integrase
VLYLTALALPALVEPDAKDDPGHARDRALLCLRFASGWCSSELVALDIGDLSFGDDGLEIVSRRSKTGPGGPLGATSASLRWPPPQLPGTPVRDCIDFSLITGGPVFRFAPSTALGKVPEAPTHQSVALIVKRWAPEAGFGSGALRRPLPAPSGSPPRPPRPARASSRA